MASFAFCWSPEIKSIENVNSDWMVDSTDRLSEKFVRLNHKLNSRLASLRPVDSAFIGDLEECLELSSQDDVLVSVKSHFIVQRCLRYVLFTGILPNYLFLVSMQEENNDDHHVSISMMKCLLHSHEKLEDDWKYLEQILPLYSKSDAKIAALSFKILKSACISKRFSCFNLRKYLPFLCLGSLENLSELSGVFTVRQIISGLIQLREKVTSFKNKFRVNTNEISEAIYLFIEYPQGLLSFYLYFHSKLGSEGLNTAMFMLVDLVFKKHNASYLTSIADQALAMITSSTDNLYVNKFVFLIFEKCLGLCDTFDFQFTSIKQQINDKFIAELSIDSSLMVIGYCTNELLLSKSLLYEINGICSKIFDVHCHDQELDLESHFHEVFLGIFNQNIKFYLVCFSNVRDKPEFIRICRASERMVVELFKFLVGKILEDVTLIQNLLLVLQYIYESQFNLKTELVLHKILETSRDIIETRHNDTQKYETLREVLVSLLQMYIFLSHDYSKSNDYKADLQILESFVCTLADNTFTLETEITSLLRETIFGNNQSTLESKSNDDYSPRAKYETCFLYNKYVQLTELDGSTGRSVVDSVLIMVESVKEIRDFIVSEKNNRLVIDLDQNSEETRTVVREVELLYSMCCLLFRQPESFVYLQGIQNLLLLFDIQAVVDTILPLMTKDLTSANESINFRLVVAEALRMIFMGKNELLKSHVSSVLNALLFIMNNEDITLLTQSCVVLLGVIVEYNLPSVAKQINEILLYFRTEMLCSSGVLRPQRCRAILMTIERFILALENCCLAIYNQSQYTVIDGVRIPKANLWTLKKSKPVILPCIVDMVGSLLLFLSDVVRNSMLKTEFKSYGADIHAKLFPLKQMLSIT